MRNFKGFIRISSALHTFIFMCVYLVLSNFTSGVNLCEHHHNKHTEDYHYKDPQNHSHNHLLHSPFGISCQSLIYYPLLLFSHSVVSSSLRPHGLQHARLPCPSLSPGVCSNSCPLGQWHHPTISSSVAHFSCSLQSFPESGSSPMSPLFALSVAKVLELQLQHQSFQWVFRVDFL